MGTTFSLSLKEVKDIIQKNKRGIQPEVNTFAEVSKEDNQMEVSLDERIDRFDKKANKPAAKNKKRNLRPKNRSNQKFVVKKNN